MRNIIEKHFGAFLAAVGVLIGICTVTMMIYLSSATADASVDRAVRNATLTIEQYKALRGYYARRIVAKVKKNGMKIDFNHSAADTIPLPATMMHDLSRLLNEKGSGLQFNLYSHMPFPNRNSRKLDDFQKESLAFLQKNRDKLFVKTDLSSGKETVRVAMADVMVNQSCIDCHNAHPLTPKNNWRIGDLRGAMEITTDITHDIQTNVSIRNGMIWFTVATLLIVGFLIFILLQSRVSRRARISKILTKVHAAADGDFTQDINDRGEDDIGQMSTALARFLETLRNSISTIASNAGELEGSSKNLKGLSDQLSSEVSTVSGQVDVVSSSAESVSVNVQSVANATNEMGTSIKEIASQTNQASRVASTGVDVAETTNSIVQQLGDSSAEISQVSKVITSIAEQTNLLALNATIEAARAGEAGKGFAVVANEVKELAKESANASEQISNRISAIQRDSNEAVEAIGNIRDIIHEINEIQTAIAGAVEEQSATANEISRNVNNAADGSKEIAGSMSHVTEAATRANSAVSEMDQASSGLAQMATALQSLVSKFKYSKD